MTIGRRIFAFFLALAAMSVGADDVIRSVGELKAFHARGKFGIRPVELTGLILHSEGGSSANHVGILQTDDGRCEFFHRCEPGATTGSLVRLSGRTVMGHAGERFIDMKRLDVLGTRPLPDPLRIGIARLDEQEHDLLPVSVEGTVIDAFADEIDFNCTFLLVKDGAATLPVAIIDKAPPRDEIVDAYVRLTGIYHRTVHGSRKFSGPYLSSARIDVLRPPPADPFDVPTLEPLIYLTPREVATLDRRRIDGEVLARWDDTRMMVREHKSKRIVNVTLSDASTLPDCGESVVVSGYPETDLFRLNLGRARWRRTESAPSAAPEEPTDVTPETILSENGHARVDSLYHGRLIRLTGIVRSLPTADGRERRMILDCGADKVSVDVSACPEATAGLALGSEIAVTGRCLMETERWRTDNIFPRLRGFSVLLRTPQDVRVLRRPPWWTPARLLTVIVGLLAALLAILVWNRLLQRLVERRGRELYRAEIAKAGSELRVDERTRLAVELHDTVSQNLTGIALEINAGEYDLAQKTLKACREELKNCIWDLRNNALEEADLNDAIRRTLAPHLGDTRLAVRFNVPRTRFTDNTAHALLRIIRELAVNAIRHGQAKEIRVAGAFEGDRLLFSVTDDGCGFDPATAPGMDKGHFGLVGVRERVESFNGDLHIESAPGRGTKVSICLKSKC